MKNNQKILLLITLIFVFLFCNSSIVCLANDVKGTNYEFEVYTLMELEIIDYRSDGTYRPYEMVTKAEMIKSLVIASGLKPAADVSKGDTKFKDVPSTHFASGYINVACQYGYIDDTAGKYFEPDDIPTYAEALTYILKAAGYQNVIENKGSWPANYIAKAIELDLLKNIQITSYNNGVNRGNWARLLFNMLQAPMWNISSGLGESVVYGQDNYMLTTKFRNYEYVNDVYNGYNIIESSDGAEVFMSIGDELFKYSGNDFNIFEPGSKVECFVNTKEKSILAMYITQNNNTIENDFHENLFVDIAGTEYELAGNVLAKLGIINVSPDGKLKPEEKVTKAEMLKILVCAYGLDDVATLYSGATPFDDVREDHWASGHINIASDFNFTNVALEEIIRNACNNDNPNNSSTKGLRPDDTIMYAEAITYCLRALGYGDVIDCNGTWPTNYIEKAMSDLNLLDGITIASYKDPMTRGNAVKLLWNMLKTKMWALQDVSDREENGLVKKASMLNVKFPEYKIYMQEEFDYYEIKVNSKDDAEVIMNVACEEYKYDKNDFYTFIPTMKVDALVNTQKEELLVICPNEDKRIIEGTKAEFDDKYDALAGEKFDYIYALVENRNVENNTMLTATSYYIDELKKYDDLKIVLKSNGLDELTFTETEVSENIFLKDGERVNLLYDIKVGDILTKVEIKYPDISNKERTFWIIGTDEYEGKLREYVIKEYEEDGIEYHVITVDEKSFCVDLNARYVEDTTKAPLVTKTFYNSSTPDMKDEIVIVKRSPIFNKAVRIEFYGKINAGYMEKNKMMERKWTTTDYVIGSEKYLSKQVESITILTQIPTTGIEEKWDISYSGDGSVVAWVEESSILSDGTLLYDLYIASNGIIVPESCGYLFADYINCTSIEGLEYFETADVKEMDWMFQHCENLVSLNLSSFNTKKVTSFDNMFYECNNLELILIGNGCTFLEQIPNNDTKIICTEIAPTSSDIIPLTATESKDKLIFYAPNLATEKIYEENLNYISVFGKDRIKPILSLIGNDTVNVIRWANYKDDGIKIADYTCKELNFDKFGFAVYASGIHVDTSKLGTIKIVYTLKYSSGDNTNRIELMQVERTINVIPNELGDTNSDGKITLSDLQRIYTHLSGSNEITNEEHLLGFDINGDGKVTSSDLQRLYNHLNGSHPL